MAGIGEQEGGPGAGGVEGALLGRRVELYSVHIERSDNADMQEIHNEKVLMQKCMKLTLKKC